MENLASYLPRVARGALSMAQSSWGSKLPALDQRFKKKQRVGSRMMVKDDRKGKQVSLAGGDSESRFVLMKPISSKIGALAKDFVPSVYLKNDAQRTECTDGTQTAFQLAAYFSDVDTALLFALQNGGATAKVHLKSCHAENLITNQANVNARIKIYDVMTRRETNATTTDVLIAFQNGFADATGGGANSFDIVGATPYSNSRFLEFFKILKHTDVILSPGATHNHIVHYTPNRLISRAQVADTAGTGTRDLTIYTLVLFYGSPINAVSTQTEVTTSAISLDVVSTREYRMAYVHSNAQTIDFDDTLDRALSSAGAVMTDIGIEVPFNEA